MSLISRNTPTFSKPEVRRQHLGQAADGGLHFDGAAGYVSCGDSTILDGATKLSIEVIIQTTSTTEGRIIAKQFDAIAYALRNDAAGTLTASIGNGSSNVNVTTSGTYNDGKPHHVVVTWDNATIKIYVDGTQDGNGTLAGGSIQNTSDFLELGARAKSGSRNSFFKGVISRARLHNRVIDAKVAFENQNIDFSEQWGSQTSLVDASASTFEGTSTFSWNPFGSNTVANTNNQLVITYSNNGSGAYHYLKDSYRLTSDLTLNKKYKFVFEAKYAGGSAPRFMINDGQGTVYGENLTTSMVKYEIEFVPKVDNQTIYVALNNFGTGNVVTLDNYYVYPVGCVSDYCLSEASPSASLMLADRSTNSVDGTISASGVEAISKPIQISAVAARIGTGAVTPADNELIAGKLTVGDSTSNELLVGFESSSQDFGIGANGTNFMIGTSATDLDTGNLVTITSAGNVEQHTNSNGIVKYAVKNEDTGTSARAMVNVSSDSANLDIMANSAAYNGVSGWGDSGVISTGSGSSGGLKLNAVAGGLALQTGQTTRMSIDSAGEIVVNDSTGTEAGRITTIGNNLTISGTVGNHCGFSFATNSILPCTESATNNNIVSLGQNGNGFKDLYLGGAANIGGLASLASGVYFSGQTGTSATGASTTTSVLNHFEVGTFTVTLAGASSVGNTTGYYTRIGNIVHVCYYSGSFTSDGSAASITGLPFTVNAAAYGGFFCYHNTYVPTADTGYFSVNTTTGYFTASNSTTSAPSANASGRYLMFTGTYKV